MKLTGKKVAILVEDIYEDQELWYPYYRLKEEGAEVVLVGPEAGKTYSSKHGYPAEANEAANNISLDSLHGVLIPGGYAPDKMRREAAMVQLAKDAIDRGKTVAAICHAGWLLCSTGILSGRRATSFFSIKDDMVNAGVEWVDEEVVVDDNLITSRTPNDLPAYLRAIIDHLSGEN
jgi:protease I